MTWVPFVCQECFGEFPSSCLPLKDRKLKCETFSPLTVQLDSSNRTLHAISLIILMLKAWCKLCPVISKNFKLQKLTQSQLKGRGSYLTHTNKDRKCIYLEEGRGRREKHFQFELHCFLRTQDVLFTTCKTARSKPCSAFGSGYCVLPTQCFHLF